MEREQLALQSTGYIELLRRNRDFRQLWLGQVVSQMGDWFNTIALYTIVLDLTGSGRAVGLVLVARFLPSVIVGPASGVIADRFSRRSIMIVSDIARAAVVEELIVFGRQEGFAYQRGNLLVRHRDAALLADLRDQLAT